MYTLHDLEETRELERELATLIREETPVARKEYRCQACDWIREDEITGEYYTYAELRKIVKARQEGWRIKKGEKYIKQILNNGGELYTYRARPEIHDICLKYDIFCD